jgi:hypothetical protein
MKFKPGTLVATRGAIAEFSQKELQRSVLRHLQADWGDTCPEDAELNDRALADGGRILSVYAFPESRRLWIITEADRSATTCLLPEEY